MINFNTVYNRARLLEALEIPNAETLLEMIKNNDKALLAACRIPEFPSYVFEDNEYFCKKINHLINYINSLNKDNEANPVQAILWILRKTKTLDDFMYIFEGGDTIGRLTALYHYSRASKNSKIQKSKQYKAFMNSSLDTLDWKELEEFGNNLGQQDISDKAIKTLHF